MDDEGQAKLLVRPRLADKSQHCGYSFDGCKRLALRCFADVAAYTRDRGNGVLPRRARRLRVTNEPSLTPKLSKEGLRQMYLATGGYRIYRTLLSSNRFPTAISQVYP